MSEHRLNKYEIAAMWLYGEDYSVGGLSAVDWWKQLSEGRRNSVIEFVDAVLAAPFGTWGGVPLRQKVRP